MVQDFGLRLLQRQDNLSKTDERFDQMRLALLASGSRTIQDLFPEYFPGQRLEVTEETPEDALSDPETAYDYSGVEWGSPSEMDAEQLRMLEQFLADPFSEVDGADLDDGPTEREWV